MGKAKGCGFLATSLLLLILLIDSSVACSGNPYPDVRRYCTHDILLNGTYTDTYEPKMNNFRINRVLKGPRNMKNVVQIYDEQDKCDYRPEDVNVEDFIIGAYQRNGKIICSFNQLLKKRYVLQLEALKIIARKGCN